VIVTDLKPYIAHDAREAILDHIAAVVRYWATLPDKSPQERCHGVAFSILTMIDGCADLPAMDLVMRPHPDDEAFLKDEGERWWPDGLVVNDDHYLHEIMKG
jgi:hypothetical protein